MSRREARAAGRSERVAARTARIIELSHGPDSEGAVLARKLADAACSGDYATVGDLAADATADRLLACAVISTLAGALADVARQVPGAVV